MSFELPDVNVLVALVVADHLHHAEATEWLRRAPERVKHFETACR